MRCKVSDFFALSEVPPSFSLRLTLFSPYFYTLFTLKRATCEVSFANKGGDDRKGNTTNDVQAVKRFFVYESFAARYKDSNS